MEFEVTKKTPVRRLIALSILPLMAIGFLSCAEVQMPPPVARVENVTVRIRPVRILVGRGAPQKPLIVSSSGPVTVAAPGGPDIETVTLTNAPVTLDARTIVVGGRGWRLPAVVLRPAPGAYVRVNGNDYPGQIMLIGRGDWPEAINFAPMDDYIAGVVSCELPARFDMEAQKAQAVAARSYALYTMSQTGPQPYDLKDDTSSQVYRGVSGTNASGRRAAAETAGGVLIYNWDFLPAFYFSTCGGMTAPASQLATAPQIPPLAGGVECDYCRASKKYRWSVTVPLAEMEAALARAGLAGGGLIDVRVASTENGGWVDAVDITSTAGAARASGYAFRQAVGVSRLYSTNFTISRVADVFMIEGRGFGHGVGLCQFGADGMGQAGFNYVEILNHYYPGAQVMKIY